MKIQSHYVDSTLMYDIPFPLIDDEFDAEAYLAAPLGNDEDEDAAWTHLVFYEDEPDVMD